MVRARHRARTIESGAPHGGERHAGDRSPLRTRCTPADRRTRRSDRRIAGPREQSDGRPQNRERDRGRLSAVQRQARRRARAESAGGRRSRAPRSTRAAPAGDDADRATDRASGAAGRYRSRDRVARRWLLQTRGDRSSHGHRATDSADRIVAGNMATRQPVLDTIVAPATPIGRSALAVVRIDGPLSIAILSQLASVSIEPRIATLVHLHHNGQLLDQCIILRYGAPHSFTGNDLVELTLHGSHALVEGVVRASVELGARLAEPGEFTERAVLNGKLDLVQAESIADVINARTALQASLSLANLEGTLSQKATAIRESLLHVISRLEAALDFSEEGYEFIQRSDARAIIERAIEDAEALLETYRRGLTRREGLSAVILGRPNAGKSTLLNRLVGTDRAIVTPIPGTTRDIVRETIEIGGLPVTLADTAGLRQNSHAVQSSGL